VPGHPHMHLMYTHTCLQDFWGVFNNIRPPSRLNPGSNYHLFKSGIEPMWEHPANMSGGKWTYSIPKKDGKKLIDDMWLYTVLAMIGENFEAGDQLCGAVIRSVQYSHIRKSYDSG
jgi:translation initiation factor 4E